MIIELIIGIIILTSIIIYLHKQICPMYYTTDNTYYKNNGR